MLKINHWMPSKTSGMCVILVKLQRLHFVINVLCTDLHFQLVQNWIWLVKTLKIDKCLGTFLFIGNMWIYAENIDRRSDINSNRYQFEDTTHCILFSVHCNLFPINSVTIVYPRPCIVTDVCVFQAKKLIRHLHRRSK